MTKYFIDTATDQTVVAKTANDTWIVKGSGQINTTTTGIDASGGAAGRSIVVNGMAHGLDYGILFGKADGAGGGEITIGANGVVDSDDKAIFSRGNDQVITNEGEITGENGIYSWGEKLRVFNDGLIQTYDQGIAIEKGSATIVNTGEITAEGGIWAPSYMNGGASEVTVVNSGTITGGKIAVELVSVGTHTIRNTGTVDGDVLMGDQADVLRNADDGEFINGEIMMGAGKDRLVNLADILEQISFGEGDDTFVNRGSVTDTVDLGAGNDTADLSGGTVSGLVVGMNGDDTFIVDKQTNAVFEGGGEGTDTIRTSVSYSLIVGANGEIENLVAIGQKNIALTGNGFDNRITGNSGNNRIDGGDGDDILRGGTGVDTFVFRTGSDHDKVMDFQNGVDRIDVSGWSGIDNFNDIKAILSVDGDDLVISTVADELVLHDMKKADLNAADFIF